ncbi:hypothetical protein B1A75_18625 [Geobacillus sp. LEMMY01]|nr:hypothetical protein B1A75_18625 [Geobacillus sp. LEMMY01]
MHTFLLWHRYIDAIGRFHIDGFCKALGSTAWRPNNAAPTVLHIGFCLPPRLGAGEKEAVCLGQSRFRQGYWEAFPLHLYCQCDPFDKEVGICWIKFIKNWLDSLIRARENTN